MKERLKLIALALFAWNVIGFVIGICVTYDARSDYRFESGKTIDISKSGCVYSSAASFTNVGYVAACELYRRRFAIEGVIR